jgi:sulfate adenylyltransferase
MPDLIPPHGGLIAPVDRTVREPADQFLAALAGKKKLVVSDADLSSLYRIGDGGLSPLTGPMTRAQWDQVLDEEVIISGGQKYAWSIPIALPADDATATSLSAGDIVALTNSAGDIVGKLEVRDVYAWDKPRYIKIVYGTERVDHPGGRMVTEDSRTHLVGGEAWVLPQPKNPEYGHLVLTPLESRALFQKKGWQRVVAFQTRNALHRAHEYALVLGLERLTRAGFLAGAVLNPLIGETKSDDVDALTRMRTYMALIANKAIGQGDKDEALWKEKGYDLTDQLILLGLDIKMFYGGPKEAVMHAIYRQNFGFTDIIIGRKHADAPYDDGKDIWDGLAAQRKFDELKGDLKIQPVKVGFAAFFEELGRVGLVEDYAPKGFKQVSISGRDLREKLRKGELPDPRIMRPETARVLIEKYSKS